jgi:hypothetical protein
MQAFLIDLEDKPGALARIAETLAAKGVNIDGVGGGSCGAGSARLALITSDDAATRSALSAAGTAFREQEAAEVSLRNQPGMLAQAARRLADAGVNIETIMPVGMEAGEIVVSFVTDQPAKAREVLATVGAHGT